MYEKIIYSENHSIPWKAFKKKYTCHDEIKKWTNLCNHIHGTQIIQTYDTDTLHWRTALTHNCTEHIRLKRKSRQIVKTTDKTRTQGRELVGHRLQSNSGNYTTFFSLNSIKNQGRADRPTTETQDREQTQNKRHLTVSIAQLTNGPQINRTKFTHWF